MKSFTSIGQTPGEIFLTLEPISPDAIKKKFSSGDVISARILKKLDRHRFILNIQGMKLIGTSHIDFDEGKKIFALVQDTLDQVRLKLISDPSSPAITQKDVKEILNELNIKPDIMHTNVLLARMKYQLPLDKESIAVDVKNITEHLIDIKGITGESPLIQEWSELFALIESNELPLNNSIIETVKTIIPPPDNLPDILEKINQWIKSEFPLDFIPTKEEINVDNTGILVTENKPQQEFLSILNKFTTDVSDITPEVFKNKIESVYETLPHLLGIVNELQTDIKNEFDLIMSSRGDISLQSEALVQNAFDNLLRKLFNDDVIPDKKEIIESFMKDTEINPEKDKPEQIKRIINLVNGVFEVVNRIKDRPDYLIQRFIQKYPDFIESLSTSLFNDPEKLIKSLSFHIEHQGFYNETSSRFQTPSMYYIELPIGKQGEMMPTGIRIYKKKSAQKQKSANKNVTHITIILKMSLLGNIRSDITYYDKKNLLIDFKVSSQDIQTYIQRSIEPLRLRLSASGFDATIKITADSNISKKSWADLREFEIFQKPDMPTQVDILI